MARLLLCVLVVLFYVYESEAKTYNRCSLARELHNRGIPTDEVNHYVCFVEHNSFDTDWTGGPYDDDTKNFGLFQLNTNDWCVIGKPGGRCNLDCNSLIDDDITDDIQCARKVHKRYGFDPWWVWRSHCKSGPPDLSYCFSGNSSPGGGSPGGGSSGSASSADRPSPCPPNDFCPDNK